MNWTLIKGKALFRPIPLVVLIVVAGVIAFFVVNRNGDLRGTWTASKDGKTYLIIENADGYPDRPILVDGSPWLQPVGLAGRIEPGVHSIGCCGGEIGFRIRPGVVYRFNYWGP
jgi:hypothetical protein